MAQIQQLIDIGIFRGVLGLQTDMHTVPRTNQRFTVIQNHIHRRCILPVIRMEPAGQNVICPDTGRETAQLGGNILRPVLFDGISGIDHGGCDKTQKVSSVFVWLKMQLPHTVITGNADAGIIVGAFLLRGGDALGQIQGQIGPFKGDR